MKNLFFTIFILAGVFSAHGQKSRTDAPLTIQTRIVDKANLLTPQQKEQIFSLIKNLEKNVGSQIAIMTIQSLNGQSLTKYATDMANQMGLGRKVFKDGILILFAVNDGQFRTEVGLGLNQIITDQIATLINETVIAPQFRAGNYSQGFYNGVKALKERIEADRALIGKRP